MNHSSERAAIREGANPLFHLDATCFFHQSEWPAEAVWPPLSACGEAGPASFCLDGACPLCLVRFDEAAAAGLVALVPYGHGHEVVCQHRVDELLLK